MIAAAKPCHPDSRSRMYAAKFLTLLPLIQAMARRAFARQPLARRQELVAEVVANCWVAFVRLMDRGLEDLVYATPLAQYAIKQVRDGRRVGSKRNVRDVSSPYAQQRRGFHLDRLDQYSPGQGCWREILVEDRKASPADTAASRIDFAEWLRSLPIRPRGVAETLAIGESTGIVARRFGLSTGRVSQLRRELKDNWDEFQGDAVA